MDDQVLKAIFRDFFSQLRMLRPVAMLHLAGCGLTKTCAVSLDSQQLMVPCFACKYLVAVWSSLGSTHAGAQLFSWCAANLELTRLDVSNNPDLSFQGTGLTTPPHETAEQTLCRGILCGVAPYYAACCGSLMPLSNTGASLCPGFVGDSVCAELDLQGFRSFVNRSAYLEALQMHHTGKTSIAMQPNSPQGEV